MEIVIGGILLFIGYRIWRGQKKRNLPALSTERANTSAVGNIISIQNSKSDIAPAPQRKALEEIEITPEIAEVISSLKASAAPVMVLGKAGTGKSTLIRFLRSHPDFENNVVLAPTGIAAINVRGQTIHSFFRFPPRLITPDALSETRPNRLWRNIKYVFIDEVSMVRADLLDGIDYRLRNARHIDQPFGGVRVVLVGDFFQLPPVVPKTEQEMLERMGYETPFAFSSKVFKEANPKILELTKIYRQTDSEFVGLLNNIRSKNDLGPTLEALNSQCVRPHRQTAIPLVLTGTNAVASDYNEEGLDALPGQPDHYRASATGNFNLQGDKLPAPELLSLKPGARVMALKNHGGKEWVNGSLGTVIQTRKDSVLVRFDGNSRDSEVTRAAWENVRYEWDDEKQHPVAIVVGAFEQIPLNLAWAVTVHKAQGLTLADVRIDLAEGAFASGQAYVALSRAKSIAGLSLCRALLEGDIIVDWRLIEFYNRSLVSVSHSAMA